MYELLKSEIKKAERFASKRDGQKVSMTGYYTDNKVDDIGFVQFQCEMCSSLDERKADVIVEVFTTDRRRSWAHSK